MAGQFEKPIFIDVRQNSPEGQDAEAIQAEIRNLCESQPFAVLASSGKVVTDASLISFAVSRDLKFMVFATPVHTGKFDLIAENENVSVLVDDRNKQQESINQISALTVIGKGRILSDEEEILKWTALLTEKHPYLMDFVKAPSSAVILIEVVRYLYVKRFQDLFEWVPNH